MAKANVERVIVTVQDQHIPAIQSVANALQSAGMHVTNVLPAAGVITGEVGPAQKQALTTVAGGAAVEADQEMHTM